MFLAIEQIDKWKEFQYQQQQELTREKQEIVSKGEEFQQRYQIRHLWQNSTTNESPFYKTEGGVEEVKSGDASWPCSFRFNDVEVQLHQWNKRNIRWCFPSNPQEPTSVFN